MSAERLQASIGSAHRDTFDFAAMSRMLTAASVNVPMAESRRQRVRGLLATLRTQRFFPPATESDKWIGVAEPYSFVFDTCSEAVAAYRERLPKMTELAKAMAIAKLETDGEYSEARHDAFFAEFGDNGLDADDIAAFPDYLICLRAADFRAAESDLILRAFVAGMPAKLVVQTDDLLEQSPIRDDYLDRRPAQPATRQHARSDLARPMSCRRAARTCSSCASRCCAGWPIAGRRCSACSPARTAAACRPIWRPRRPRNRGRSRPSPTIRRREPDWASRFSLAANSQVDLDWPVQRLDYEDAEQQRVSETVAFTLVDFARRDPRCAKYFAKVPRAKWTADLLPVAEFLTREPKDLPKKCRAC